MYGVICTIVTFGHISCTKNWNSYLNQQVADRHILAQKNIWFSFHNYRLSRYPCEISMLLEFDHCSEQHGYGHGHETNSMKYLCVYFYFHFFFLKKQASQHILDTFTALLHWYVERNNWQHQSNDNKSKQVYLFYGIHNIEIQDNCWIERFEFCCFCIIISVIFVFVLFELSRFRFFDEPQLIEIHKGNSIC